jgi:uncharacterized damage-inducible protein DinB
MKHTGTRTMHRTPPPVIALLLHSLDEAYDQKAWHGPNLKGALRGIDFRQAQWRPARGRHNIWEIVVHAAYWKYAVRQRLMGGQRGSFARRGSNWIRRTDELTQSDWRKDLILLQSEHKQLRATVEGLRSAGVFRTVPNTRYTAAKLIFGAAAHDLYHAGQIQLIKRLFEKSRH